MPTPSSRDGPASRGRSAGPRSAQFVDALPKSGAGRVKRRELQEREIHGAAAAP